MINAPEFQTAGIGGVRLRFGATRKCGSNLKNTDFRKVVRFEVFTAVTMKNGVFWDVTPCGFYKNRRFGGTWRLLHQVDKNRYVGCYLQLVLFLVHRFLSPWWRRRQVPPKRRFLQEPHCVTSQKTQFFRKVVYSRSCCNQIHLYDV
jgi:hypothetical protein